MFMRDKLIVKDIILVLKEKKLLKMNKKQEKQGYLKNLHEKKFIEKVGGNPAFPAFPAFLLSSFSNYLYSVNPESRL